MDSLNRSAPIQSRASLSPRRLGESGTRLDREGFTSGAPALDARLGGGLARGALHEVCSASAAATAAATGFGLALALRAGGAGLIGWVHHEALDHEAGRPDGSGLRELGGDPAHLVLTRLRRAEDVLQAALDAARCVGLGAVLVQLRAETPRLDLVATRRLVLAAGASGTTVIFLRGAPGPSAAMTRWGVAPAPSTPLEAGAPGHPAFLVSLLRHRGGRPGGPWRVEWSRDRQSFADGAPLSGALVSVPADRPAAAALGGGRAGWNERRAG